MARLSKEVIDRMFLQETIKSYKIIKRISRETLQKSTQKVLKENSDKNLLT